MKKFFTTVLAVAGAAALLTSCKKDIQQDTSTTAASEVAPAVRGGGVITPAPVYTLTKRGADSLIYDASSRLIKVQHSAVSFTKYTYGFNTITSETFSNNQLTRKNIYQIDVNSGRVFESEEHKYSYPAPNVTYHDQKWWKFEYNAEGQLTKKYNKYKNLERSVFGWNSGNMVSTSFMDENNAPISHTHYYHYANADKLKLRSAATGLDSYLKIFGKGSKNLMSLESRSVYVPQITEAKESFKYQLNADGYPATCAVTDELNKKPLYSLDYGYKLN